MKKKLTIFLLLTISGLLLSVEGHSQSTFLFQYSSLIDEWPEDVVETADGGFIVAAFIGQYPPSVFSTLIIKLDANGDTVLTKTISKSSGNCIIGDLVKAGDGNFFGIGKQVFSGEERIWLVKMNAELDIIKDTTYSIGAFKIVIHNGFIDQYEDLILYGSSSGTDLYNHPYIYKLTQEGDSISYRYYNDSTSSEYVNSMIEKPDLSGYYMVILGDYQINLPTSEQILSFNYNLDVVDTDSLPGRYALYYNTKVFNNHQFIYTGKKITSTSPRTDKIGIQKLDTAFISLASYLFGPEDTITYPASFRNIDFLDTNKIFLAGVSNTNIGTPFPMDTSFFLVGNFDASLNLSWQKYYGGDQYYSAKGVLVTNDGGCLIYGSSFNYQTQTNERDIYIIKVDSNGVITSTDETWQVAMHDAIVYPNPGKDYLMIESGPQVTGATMVITDIYGKQVLSETLKGSRININTHSLHAGTYLWQIILRNKVIETGKWIKY